MAFARGNTMSALPPTSLTRSRETCALLPEFSKPERYMRDTHAIISTRYAIGALFLAFSQRYAYARSPNPEVMNSFCFALNLIHTACKAHVSQLGLFPCLERARFQPLYLRHQLLT